MHPGIFARWKHAREQSREASAHCCGGSCGPHEGHEHGDEAADGLFANGGSSAFGVRRPLRFMAHKLELDEAQVKVLARILNDLKTERAQAEVDSQRALGQIADALDAETFDAAKVEAVLKGRLSGAERVETAVLRALGDTHGMLTAEQRGKLAYLLRSGHLTI